MIPIVARRSNLETDYQPMPLRITAEPLAKTPHVKATSYAASAEAQQAIDWMTDGTRQLCNT